MLDRQPTFVVIDSPLVFGSTETLTRPSGTLGAVWVVKSRSVQRVLTIGFCGRQREASIVCTSLTTDTVSIVTITCGAHRDTIAQPHLAVGQHDELTHTATFKLAKSDRYHDWAGIAHHPVISLVLRVSVHRPDPDTRVIGRDGSDVVVGATVIAPLRRV